MAIPSNMTTIFRTKHYLRGPYILSSSTGETVSQHDGQPPHKWMPGDHVNPTTGAVVSRNLPKSIVGIVDFLSRTGQGFTGRGVPLYMFYPLDVSYPPMTVSSKTKPPQNMLVIVSVEHWNEKWPRASIKTTLGPVGSIETERQALLMRSMPNCNGACAEDYSALRATTDAHERIDWDVVCNIDPDGCMDVDDVFCWRRVGDAGWEFAIAIADVAAWVPEGGAEGSSLDTMARAAGQTLYVDGRAEVPMLPHAVSSGSASLRCDGVERPVLALVYTLTHTNVTRTWKQLLVRVTEAHTYDTLPAERRDTIAKLLGACTECHTSGMDSHTLVEIAMIEYNVQVANLLRDRVCGVLRAHAGKSSDYYTELAEKTDCADIAILGYAAGSYVQAATEDVSHAGLGLKQYCHASSPLRRYADLVNQRWMKHILFEAPAPTTECDVAALNARGQIAKRLDRDMWFLTYLKPDQITEARGYIVKQHRDGSMSAYVPTWKRTVRGKATADAVELGARVGVRAYTDLKRAQWDQRMVCLFTS